MGSTKATPRISTMGSRFSSILSVSVVLLLLGIGAMATMISVDVTDELRRNTAFIVKVEKDCDDIRLADIKVALNSHSDISSISYISADSVFNQEKEYMGWTEGQEPTENPYFAEFDVVLDASATDPEHIKSLRAYVEVLDGVVEVVSEDAVIAGVDHTLRRIANLSWCVAIVLVLVAIALIASTVSLSLYSKRNTIYTMRLVGATASYIRRPFVIGAIRVGFLAWIISSVILIMLRGYLTTFDLLISHSLGWWHMIPLIIVLCATSIALCGITASTTINKHLKSSYEDLYTK